MLKKMLKECGAVKHGDFTLSSGKKSKMYIDIKMAITSPKVLKEVAKQMSQYMGKDDNIAGFEMGGIPLAVALALETKRPYLIVRKEKKGHGTSKRIEGDLPKTEKMVLVEDVITTAKSAIKGVEVLREAGYDVNTVLAVVDREEGGTGQLKNIGVNLHALISKTELEKK